MPSKVKKNIKIYLIFILIIIIILSFWFYSLKINLQNHISEKDNKSGYTLKELKQEVSNIIYKSPLSKKSKTKNRNKDEQLNKLTNKLVEKIKNNERE